MHQITRTCACTQIRGHKRTRPATKYRDARLQIVKRNAQRCPRDQLGTLAIVAVASMTGSLLKCCWYALGIVGMSPDVELVPRQQSHVLNDIIIMP